MRVPVYEVKVNGSTIPIRKINIDLPPKNLKARATIEAPKDVNLDIGDLVEITFFDVLLYRGEVVKIKKTQEGKTFTVSYKSPTVPRVALTNLGLPEEDREDVVRTITKPGYAIDLWADLFKEYGYTLVNVGPPPPLKAVKIVVDGDLLQGIADYFREFAPIIYQDPAEKTVYVIWEPQSPYTRTWGIPDRAIISYELSEEGRCIYTTNNDPIVPIVVSNTPLSYQEMIGKILMGIMRAMEAKTPGG